MAKQLRIEGVVPTETGSRLRLERLGERYEADLDLAEVIELARALLGAVSLKHAAFRMQLEGFAFPDPAEAEPGEEPVLLLRGQHGEVIAVDLTWGMMSSLSQVATEMLRRAPTGDRPS